MNMEREEHGTLTTTPRTSTPNNTIWHDDGSRTNACA